MIAKTKAEWEIASMELLAMANHLAMGIEIKFHPNISRNTTMIGLLNNLDLLQKPKSTRRTRYNKASLINDSQR
jgi:hypothetical protein